jgi:dTDP-4-dehydrorhamnose reductase
MAIRKVIVGNGFIASHLNYPILHDRIEASYNYIANWLDDYKPDVVINCIGYCGGANIDGCEINKSRTFQTNTILPIMLASVCAARDIRVIQIGSGCIFYGESPNAVFFKRYYDSYEARRDSGWVENDAAAPLSTYSKSKYACDLALGTMKNVTTLRIRMPISDKASPRNLISKLISYKEIVEIPNSVTFLKDLSRAVDWAVSSEATGTYHVTSPKPITHSQILNEYKKYVPEHTFNSITPDELNGLVSAPRSNCIIDSSKIMNEGFEFLNQEEELKRCVKEFAENNKK